MKVTVVGAGNVGATCANCIAEKDIVNEVVLLDIKEGVAEGKSLDMWQTAPINLYDTRIKGVTNDYEATNNSEVVVITVRLFRSENTDSLETRVIPVIIARSRWRFVLNVELKSPRINEVNSFQYP